MMITLNTLDEKTLLTPIAISNYCLHTTGAGPGTTSAKNAKKKQW